MKMKLLFLPLLFLSSLLSAQKTAPSANKKRVLEFVEKHQQELSSLSNRVWGFAETSMKETKLSGTQSILDL